MSPAIVRVLCSVGGIRYSLNMRARNCMHGHTKKSSDPHYMYIYIYYNIYICIQVYIIYPDMSLIRYKHISNWNLGSYGFCLVISGARWCLQLGKNTQLQLIRLDFQPTWMHFLRVFVRL